MVEQKYDLEGLRPVVLVYEPDHRSGYWMISGSS